jgi:GT2 family glycosyltransferase
MADLLDRRPGLEVVAQAGSLSQARRCTTIARFNLTDLVAAPQALRQNQRGRLAGYFGGGARPRLGRGLRRRPRVDRIRSPVSAVTLPPPDLALRICVIVPARNEEELIGSCLRALAKQKQVSYKEYEILLVLDGCTDGTETRARILAASYPALRLHLLDSPGKGSGHARRVGMEIACERLHAVGRPHALISSTDADTVVAPDWISAQLAAAERGARAIGGRIELVDDGKVPKALLEWHLTRGDSRYRKLLSEPAPSGRTEHWQFSGASMALTAAVYRKVGGLEPRDALEDEQLEGALQRHGVPIERLLSVRVATSARLVGRAGRGLAHDLSAVARLLDVAE